ncbi:MAG: FAD binding domain-containing protein [Chloroflexota bacterium]
MITTYHRPKTLDEALTLLTQPNRIPLGGGTLLASRKLAPDSIEVVDLQSLSLDTVIKNGNNLEIGATVTLQQLLESELCPDALKSALKLEAPLNIRNTATVAGTLVASDGRSTFASLLLATDAKIEQAILNDSNIEYRMTNIGEFLPLKSTKLITRLILPLNIKLAFEYVSRTPADKPIVCATLAQWNSGRSRLALGGYGRSPMLAMDGTEAEGLETAAGNAYHEATDEWASSEYRMDVASTLAKRCLEGLH